MSPSEIAFLALGLAVGTPVGAVLVGAIRSRPAAPREVRLTITPNAIPARRSSTLAMPGGAWIPDPLPGSPEWQALPEATSLPDPAAGEPVARPSGAPPVGSIFRTRVPSGPVSLPAGAIAVPVGVAVNVAGPDRLLHPTGTRPSGADALAAVPMTARAVAVLERAGAVAVLERREPDAPAASAGRPGPAGPADAATPAGSAGSATDECAGPRRAVDDRCALADVARDQARRTTDVLRDAQRAYDILRDRVERAEADADPRRVAAEKERLHAAFRAASDRSSGPDETEAAARAWLIELNQLNTTVRDGQRVAEAGRAELRAQLPVLERLAGEADASRIAAENAAAGCRDAREQLAACEEVVELARSTAPRTPDEQHPFADVWPAEEPDMPASGALSSPEDILAGLPLVVRILRGDREARERTVTTLGGTEAESRREWQLRIARLVDAIASRAIEDGYLDTPDDHAFWRLFDHHERRDIIAALSALGFRFDGLGGFADGRAPAARDLSLAVGYAGLDRMRIRTWPRDAEIALLFDRATVGADEWLADEASDLSLGQMVDALGGRAADLADVWNAWGRVRPVLLGP